MWEYKCETVCCESDDIEDKMDAFGKLGWEIFSLQTFKAESFPWNRYELAMKREIKEVTEDTQVVEIPKTEHKLEYTGKNLFINEDGEMCWKFHNKLKTECDTVQKQNMIIPGVYDALWGGYVLNIIFENGNKSEDIETREGVRGINCQVKAIVMYDGTVHID